MSARSRKTHLVGAWPGRSAPDAMEEAFARIGDHLLQMSDGETGERSGWVKPTVEWARANPDLELVRDGDYSDMRNTPFFRVKGDGFDPANVHLQYLRAFEESFPAFKVLRERHGKPGTRFQVGIPAPIDCAWAVFATESVEPDPALAKAFHEATIPQMRAIHAAGGDDVVFQLESVVAMVAVVMAPEEQQEAVATQMSAMLADVARSAPEGANFGLHLCLGDFNHQSVTDMGSARPLVLLANACAAAWPEDRPLGWIHAPFAAAEKPGHLEEEWFEPLRELDLPEDVRFVAGFIHESLGVDDLRTVRDRIDRLTGRQVDVAATCGLGRRKDPEEAWDAMAKAVALIED